MGSPVTEQGRKDDEIQHEVTLSAFKMSKYSITFEQYDLFCEATGRNKPWGVNGEIFRFHRLPGTMPMHLPNGWAAGCPLKQNGNMQPEQIPPLLFIQVIVLHLIRLILMARNLIQIAKKVINRKQLCLLEVLHLMLSDYMICMVIFGNGRTIGTVSIM